MSVIFKSQNHKYESVDSSEVIEWTSVTSFISKYKKPFDAQTVAEKSSKSKKSKWYGMSVQDILQAWENESTRAIDQGNWYHNQREADLLQLNTIERHGCILPIIRPLITDDIKYAPPQKLQEGMYPEHFVYLKSAGICGQSDLVEVAKGEVNITDYKTNKEIKKESYVNWEGVSQKMLMPVSHLDDCNFWHYALQLSTYMYIILKHNPKLKPGKITIHHVLFYTDGTDKFGNPITKLDDQGEPLVKKIVPYDLPYLKAEVINLIKHKQDAN
jgi:ATP-dependent exoDNAse (exonuclease V) beta subunit